MKKSEMYKEIIKDVIAASDGEITDGYFGRLNFLFEEYQTVLACEKYEEEKKSGELHV